MLLLNILRAFFVGPCCCNAFCWMPTSQKGVSKDVLTWVEIQPLTFHVPFSFDYVYFIDILVPFESFLAREAVHLPVLASCYGVSVWTEATSAG
jgi:hypothetical protein